MFANWPYLFYCRKTFQCRLIKFVLTRKNGSPLCTWLKSHLGLNILKLSPRRLQFQSYSMFITKYHHVLCFRPSSNDSTLTATAREKDWFVVAYPLRSFEYRLYYLRRAHRFFVLDKSTFKTGGKEIIKTGYNWLSELLSVTTYRQIPHLSQWKGFFSTPVKCLHMKQKYAAICSPQPLQYWLPSLI